MAPRPEPAPGDGTLRRLAEKRLRKKAPSSPEGDPRRTLHELEVHQIELEMQNTDLLNARTRLEDLVEKYTDLYDFAPVGYFSLDAASQIQEVNLQGAAMIGIDRSSLLRRRFSGFVASDYKSEFKDFLRNAFGGSGKQAIELVMNTGGREPIWADLQAKTSVSPVDGTQLCRLAVAEITAQKRAQEAQLRVEELQTLTTKLEKEIARRRAVEKSLLASREEEIQLLKQSKRMEEELRLLSRQILHSQEEERRRISHELHDEIAQTLVAVNIHIAGLAQDEDLNSGDFAKKILKTQKLVEQSVEKVHRFAMDLRPAHLDDLGIVKALRGYIKDFRKQTKIPVLISVSPEMKPLDDTRSLVLYRVAQAALTNIAQHAKAKRVKLGLRQTQRSVHMEISDNGKSFDVHKTLNATKVKRLGLIGMRERVEMVGGEFAILSSRGEGTTIRVTLPRVKKPPASPSATRIDL